MHPQTLRTVQHFTLVYLHAQTTEDAVGIHTRQITVILIMGKPQIPPIGAPCWGGKWCRFWNLASKSVVLDYRPFLYLTKLVFIRRWSDFSTNIEQRSQNCAIFLTWSSNLRVFGFYPWSTNCDSPCTTCIHCDLNLDFKNARKALTHLIWSNWFCFRYLFYFSFQISLATRNMLTLIYLTPWILFLLAWWAIQFLTSTSWA